MHASLVVLFAVVAAVSASHNYYGPYNTRGLHYNNDGQIRYFNDHSGNTVPEMGDDQNNDGVEDRLDSNRDGKEDSYDKDFHARAQYGYGNAYNNGYGNAHRGNRYGYGNAQYGYGAANNFHYGAQNAYGYPRGFAYGAH